MAGGRPGCRSSAQTAPKLRLAPPLIALAAGGIENARLLVASGPREQGGLGNGHDLVGRYFMEHFPGRCRASAAPRLVPELRPYFRRMTVNGRQIKATLAPTATLLASEGLPNFVIKLSSMAKRRAGLVALLALRDRFRSNRPGQRPWAAARTLLADLPGTARAIARLASGRELGTDRHPEPLLVSVVSEQTPNPASRVTLSGRRDRFGQPLPRLDWHLVDRDRRGIWRALELLTGELDRSGFGQLDFTQCRG